VASSFTTTINDHLGNQLIVEVTKGEKTDVTVQRYPSGVEIEIIEL